MVRRLWAEAGKSRSALVVGEEDTFRMTEFYRVIMDSPEGKEVKAFRGYDEALEWLLSDE